MRILYNWDENMLFLRKTSISNKKYSALCWVKEYSKLLNRFKNELRIQFPLNRNNRKSLEQSISRYENLTKEEKDLLGSEELERIDKYRNSLSKGVDLIGRPLD